MIKYAFFDIDGVLSVPRYKDGKKFVVGGTEDWWINYLKKEKEPYKYCGVPIRLRFLLKQLKDSGVKIAVLSQEPIPEGRVAKKDFIKYRYVGLIDDFNVFFTDTEKGKVDFLAKFAAENNIKPPEILFVDDTFSIVLAAHNAGFNSHHISEFHHIYYSDSYDDNLV